MTGASGLTPQDFRPIPKTDAEKIVAAIDAVAGGGGSLELVFDTTAAANGGGVFKDWPALIAFIATLKRGQAPSITFMQSFVVPLAGMPATGWPMNLATLKAFEPATGFVGLDLPDGVSLDMLGGITFGLSLFCHPSIPYGVLRWSQFPDASGIVRIFAIGEGGNFKNYGSAPAIITPGVATQTYVVIALAYPALAAGGPPDSAPWVEANGSDVLILSAIAVGPYGTVPNNWATTASPTVTLFTQAGIDTNEFTLGAWAGLSFINVQGSKARNLAMAAPKTLYVDAGAPPNSYTVQADGTLSRPFPTIQQALDVATPNTTILIAAGSYNESLVMPDLDGLSLVATGVAPINGSNGAVQVNALVPGSPALAWTLGAASPVQRAQFSGIVFGSYGHASEAVVIDATAVAGGTGFQNGLAFNRCLVQTDAAGKYAIVVKTCNNVLLDEFNVNDQPGTLGCWFYNTAGITHKNNGSIGAARFEFDPTQPVPTTPIGFTIIAELASVAEATLVGLIAFIVAPEGNVASIDGTALQSYTLFGLGGPGFSPVLFLTGLMGNPLPFGGGTPGTIDVTMPVTPAAPVFIPPIMSMPGALMYVSDCDVATADPSLDVNARGSNWLAAGPASIAAHANVNLDLREAAFDEAQLDAAAGGTYDRSTIVLASKALAPAILTPNTWLAPLPSADYAVAIEVDDPLVGAVGVSAKTASGFGMTSALVAAAGNVRAVVSRP